MTRGTTPTYIISFDETIDFSSVDTWLITLKQADAMLSINDPVVDVEEGTLSITLSQEQTLGFKSGQARLQVRGMFADEVAFASNICTVPINPILDERVITS